MTFPFPILGARKSLSLGVVMGPLSFTTDAADPSFSNFTDKATFLIGALTAPPNTVTQVRVTLTAPSGGPTQFDKCYIGPRLGSGDTYDVSSFTQLLFSGSSGGLVPTGGTLVSDLVSFSWNKTSGLVCSIYYGVHTGNGGARYMTGLGANYSEAQFVGDSAATTNDATVSPTSGRIFTFSKIEMDGF